MIDFHTHILPGIDDGSHDVDETVQMLCEEHAQGVSKIIATPHFYAQHSSIFHFLEKREAAYERMTERIRELNLDWTLPVLKAAEVYYFPGMGRAEQLPALALENSDLLFLEMPFAQWTSEVYREVTDIIERRHLTPVLVHLERFYPYQKDASVLEDILDLPVYIQINTGSMLEWRSRRIDKKILKLGLPVILGSDCHNMGRRPPNLKQGREMIARKLGEELLQEIDRTSERLLEEHVRA